ncbi:unnamed protein product, partial [Cylicocyclus nassatus]
VDCTLLYDDFSWGFRYKASEECEVWIWATNELKQFIMVGLIAVTDAITIVKVRSYLSQMPGDSEQALSKRRSEINLFKQALLQFFMWVAEMVCYFYIVNYFTHKFVRWMLSTLAWIVMHTSDAFSVIFINQELRKLFCNPAL